MFILLQISLALVQNLIFHPRTINYLGNGCGELLNGMVSIWFYEVLAMVWSCFQFSESSNNHSSHLIITKTHKNISSVKFYILVNLCSNILSLCLKSDPLPKNNNFTLKNVATNYDNAVVSVWFYDVLAALCCFLSSSEAAKETISQIITNKTYENTPLR